MSLNFIWFFLAFIIFLKSFIASIRLKTLDSIEYAILMSVVVFIYIYYQNSTGSIICSILCILFVIIPNIISLWINRLVYQSKFLQASHLAFISSIFLPLGDRILISKYYRGFSYLEDGHFEKGINALQDVVKAGKSFSRIAEISMKSSLCDFEWVSQEVNKNDIQMSPVAMNYQIRALGELGHINEMVSLYYREKDTLALPQLSIDRIRCLMMMAAFCGERELYHQLKVETISDIQPFSKDFWHVTLEYRISENLENYQDDLNKLLLTCSPIYQKWIEYRLTQVQGNYSSETLSEESKRQLTSIFETHQKNQQFLKPSQHKKPVATVVLLDLNLLVFGFMHFSQMPFFQKLNQFGAIFYPNILENEEWWRLISASFIHLNWTHLVLNLLAFSLFPFVEKTLGTFRFTLIYIVSAIGSMFLSIMIIQSFNLVDHPFYMIGASGGIMGIIGSLLGISFKAWSTQGLNIAKRLLIAFVLMMVVQTIFDVAYLQQSCLIHLSGFVLGLSIYSAFEMLSKKPEIEPKRFLVPLAATWGAIVVFIFIFTLFKKESSFSDLQALAIGDMYTEIGQTKESVPWYLKSAEKGNKTAQVKMAYEYMTGKIVTKDYTKALFWSKKAAEQNDTWAQGVLGYFYEYGLGTPQNESLAIHWYQKASDSGDAISQYKMARYYLESQEVPKDTKKGIALLKSAAQKGDNNAQLVLGNFYADGKELPKDFQKAKALFQASAEKGNPYAQDNLGYMYDEGIGVSQNYTQAIVWYQKAAIQNIFRSQERLGFIYSNGLGVNKKPTEAYYWYSQAIKNENTSDSSTKVTLIKELNKLKNQLTTQEIVQINQRLALK